MADRFRFRARTMESTYFLIDNPGVEASILCTTRQIQAEASRVLYGSHTFEFATDHEAVVPFLSDLSLIARSSVKSICVLKRALPYTEDFNNCEWHNACVFISKTLHLTEVVLVIEAGREVSKKKFPEGFSKQDFDDKILDYKCMERARDLSAIKGLEALSVGLHWQDCEPRSESGMMAFFLQFSASIEGVFSDRLREQMLKKRL